MSDEGWSRIPGFEKYWVSTYGNVLREGREKFLKLDWSGRPRCPYRSVRLYAGNGCRRKVLLHKLVYFVFCGHVPEGMQVDHIDRNRENNALSNLRCITIEQNQSRRIYSQEVEVCCTLSL